jgi:hypothetical protein
VITRKGGKVVTIPLAPRTAGAIDLAIGERIEGPIFLTADGHRLDRHGAGRIVRRVARCAGITQTGRPARCGTRSSPPPWTPACRCATSRKPLPTLTPRTTMRYDRTRTSLDRHATYIVAAYLAGAARQHTREPVHLRLADLPPGGTGAKNTDRDGELAQEPPTRSASASPPPQHERAQKDRPG